MLNICFCYITVEIIATSSYLISIYQSCSPKEKLSLIQFKTDSLIHLSAFRLSDELCQNPHRANEEGSDFVDFHWAKVWQLWMGITRMWWGSKRSERTLSSLWSIFERPSRLFAWRASRMSFSNDRSLSGSWKSSAALSTGTELVSHYSYEAENHNVHIQEYFGYLCEPEGHFTELRTRRFQ